MTNTVAVGAVAPGENADHLRGATKLIVPEGWKLVPVEPTEEMIQAAEEAHMPFGDMDIALRLAIISAPAPDHVEHVRAMVPSVEQLAEALNDVRCFHDLSAELIAPQLRENLARMNHGPDHLRDAAKMVSAVEQSAMVVPENLREEAARCAFVMRNIGSMGEDEIEGDNVDLRFEDAEGRDSGCDISIVEYAERSADLLESLLSAAPTPEPASPWISVEDRSPKIGERVIVFTGEVEEAFYWARIPGVHDGEDGFCDLFDNDVEVSHWMPLPSAPEQPAREQDHE